MTAHQPCCTNIHAIFKVIFITVLLHFNTWFERLHVILTFHLLSSSSNVSWFSFCFSRRALFFSCSSSFASCMSLFLCCYLWLLTLHVSSVVLEIKTVCLWDFSPVVAFTLAFWCLRNGLCCRVLVIGCFWSPLLGFGSISLHIFSSCSFSSLSSVFLSFINTHNSVFYVSKS